MNKYYITVSENENGLYDFYIDLFNERTMEEPARIGTRKNIDNLGEVFDMIENFPLSQSSELTSVTYNRLKPTVKPSMLEKLFFVSMNNLLESKKKNIKEFNLN